MGVFRVAAAILGVMLSTCAYAAEVVIGPADIISAELNGSCVKLSLSCEKSEKFAQTRGDGMRFNFSSLAFPSNSFKRMSICEIEWSELTSSITFELRDEATAKQFRDALNAAAAK
jgi:hypothetical protein